MTEEMTNKPSQDRVIAIRLNLTVVWSDDGHDLEPQSENLPDPMQPTDSDVAPDTQLILRALKNALNDIHKRIAGVSKGSRKQAQQT